MIKFGNTTISRIYHGSLDINKVYKGSSLMFQKSSGGGSQHECVYIVKKGCNIRTGIANTAMDGDYWEDGSKNGYPVYTNGTYCLAHDGNVYWHGYYICLASEINLDPVSSYLNYISSPSPIGIWNGGMTVEACPGVTT